jgi:hypothetical protein
MSEATCKCTWSARCHCKHDKCKFCCWKGKVVVIKDKQPWTSSTLKTQISLKISRSIHYFYISSSLLLAGIPSNGRSSSLKYFHTHVYINHFNCFGHNTHPPIFYIYVWVILYIKLSFSLQLWTHLHTDYTKNTVKNTQRIACYR